VSLHGGKARTRQVGAFGAPSNEHSRGICRTRRVAEQRGAKGTIVHEETNATQTSVGQTLETPEAGCQCKGTRPESVSEAP
jgi:hypothetical protein